MAYIFMSAPRLGYAPWLRTRAALRLAGLAGAGIRMTSAGGFTASYWRDRIGCGLSGCVCALIGLISLPAQIARVVDTSCQKHELESAFKEYFVTDIIHWIIGGSFFVAFLAYTFPILVMLPEGKLQFIKPTYI